MSRRLSRPYLHLKDFRSGVTDYLNPNRFNPLHEWLEGSGIGDFFPECGTHEFRGWNHAHPARIEAVGIPAGADGFVRREGSIGVPGAGVDQRIEVGFFQIEKLPAEVRRVFGSTASVLGIGVFVFPLGVVNQAKSRVRRASNESGHGWNGLPTRNPK